MFIPFLPPPLTYISGDMLNTIDQNKKIHKKNYAQKKIYAASIEIRDAICKYVGWNYVSTNGVTGKLIL